MNIGDRIKELRKAEKLTQKEFSKRLCISQSYLSGLENGTEIPADKLLRLIELEFNVSVEWLNEGTGEMYSCRIDKAYLSTLSNRGLLEMLMALNTKSNRQYNAVTNIISSVGSLLKKEAFLPDAISMSYLEALSKLLSDINQLSSLMVNNRGRNPEEVKAHIEQIELSLNAVIESFTKF